MDSIILKSSYYSSNLLKEYKKSLREDFQLILLKGTFIIQIIYAYKNTGSFTSNFLATISAISFPISIDAVAAGDGALHTCTVRFPMMIWKSSTSVPSELIACARTPAGARTKSSSESQESISEGSS